MSPISDTAVVGGGFYGTMIAAHLAKRGHRVVLFERESALMTRASYVNQARVHGGYHYPRALTTGLRSHEHYGRFAREFGDAVIESRAMYAIARRGSRTTVGQFERFCRRIGAASTRCADEVDDVFDSTLVSAVFEVREAVFDALLMREMLAERLDSLGVDVRLGQEVRAISGSGARTLIEAPSGEGLEFDGVVNCTYSAVELLSGAVQPAPLQHEWTELALCRLPPALSGLAITIIDGPFFSVLPFPAGGEDVSSFSHVRYTPHNSWTSVELDFEALRRQAPRASRFDAMVRDAARFVPPLTDAVHVRSLFEVKTVPARHGRDDARPILFSTSGPAAPRIASVVGSKIDNVYDVLPHVERFAAS